MHPYASIPHPARPSATHKEIAFIDTSLADHALLKAGLRQGLLAIEFGGEADGLAQLTHHAARLDGCAAIHLLCHGEPGKLALGSRALDAASLAEQDGAAALAALGAALAPGGELLVYACSAGAGATGREFVDALARASGVAVAASATPTGDGAQGGAWALPVCSGAIETPLALDAGAAANWPHLMSGPITFDLSSGSFRDNAGFDGNVTQTLGGLTMTVSAGSDHDVSIYDTAQYGDLTFGPSYHYVAGSHNSLLVADANYGTTTSVQFSFTGAVSIGSLDFADIANGISSTIRITSLNTSDTMVVNVPANGDTRATLGWVGVTGFTITNEPGGSALPPLGIDNIVVTPGGPPTTTVAGAALSQDSGSSAVDFVTNIASQTVSGTLSAALVAGESVEVSYDGGASWHNAGGYTVGSSTWSDTTTLSGSNTLKVRVTNTYGSSTAYAHAYTVDTVAPTTTVGVLSFSNDTGASNGDFVTKNPVQTIGATLSAALAAGEVLYASLDNGVTWTDVTASVSGTSVHWSTTLSSGGNTLQFKVVDLAGNNGVVAAQAYTVDTVAPTTTVGALSLSADTGASSTDFVTKTAAQTVAATLSAALSPGDTLFASADSGATWTDISAGVSGTAVSWNTTLNIGNNALQFKVVDLAGNGGAVTARAYVLDTFAPAAPGRPAMDALSDSGASHGDAITNVSNPTIGGTAEANATITLYDTDIHGATTEIATTTANGSGVWSLNHALTEGAHNLSVTARDTAGNVSAASSALAVVIDTQAPGAVAMSTNTTASASAIANGNVATLSASDATAVSYMLVVGNGINDADNGRFTISGNALNVGGASLTAGTYHLYLQAVDSAGNATAFAETLTVNDAPMVTSIVRAGGAASGVPAAATALAYTVSFSQNVTGVDASDFMLSTTGSADGNIASVVAAGSASVYTVTVDGLSGDGTLRLDLNPAGTGIQNSAGVDVASGYTAGAYFTLDHTAPAAPSAPVLNAASDSGISNADAITNVSNPTIGGTAEANATVTLYDTDSHGATTQIDTTTANGAGVWSFNHTLTEGPHNLTVKASDAAGNVSMASSALAVVIDTLAPAGVTMSATGATIAGASSGASVATLSATDQTNVSYSLVAGPVGIDADNGKFVIVGNTLRIGSVGLAAGTYHINLQALDAAGNASTVAETFTVNDAPSVSSIVRAGGAAAGVPAQAGSIAYTVTFSDNVTGVDAGDFTLTATGNAGGTIASVVAAGSASVYTVTVNGPSGDGALRLDLNPAGTGIQSSAGAAIAGGYTAGASYTLDHTAPGAPSALALSPLSDSGALGDGITNVATPIVTGSTEANASVTLYDSDGTTVLGTTTADAGGHWSIASSTLASGSHTLTARAADAAGNVSAASGLLNLSIATSAAAPSAPALAAASDSGALGDGITRIATPVVTGHASAGATVKLYDSNGATVLGATTADTSGNWSITSSTLANGSHTLTAKQIDLAGNVSPLSAGLALTIDTLAPAAPAALALASASDSGVVGDNSTLVTTPAIHGTGEANATVTLYDSNGTTVLGTALADASGNWSVTSSSLSVGSHTLTAKQADAAGNVSAASAALALTIEAPSAPPPLVDGVAVTTQTVYLPGGGTGTQVIVPIVTDSRVESSGSAGVADIPLATASGGTVLVAQVPSGFGLTAAGGPSQSAGASMQQLVQAIVAATPGHTSGDQGHLTGNGTTFLNHLASSTPLLVETVVPMAAANAPAGTLTLTGTSGAAQSTALVIDATHLGANASVALNSVDFAAVIGAAKISGATSGQVLTGDVAAQTFTVGGSAGGSVFAGGGNDTLVFNSGAKALSLAAGAPSSQAASGATTVLHGGLDNDTAVFSGASTDYTIETHQGYLVVTPNAQPAQHALLVNVENIRFADSTVAVSNGAALDAIAGLYHDILGRQADYLGIDFWASRAQAGASLGQIALEMIGSPEAQGAHGGAFNGNTAHDVELLYQAIYGRHSDAAGLGFWTDAMAHGVTLDQVAQAFVTQAEGQQHKLAPLQWDFLV